MPAEGRENPLLKKGNSDAFFREKYLTKNKTAQTADNKEQSETATTVETNKNTAPQTGDTASLIYLATLAGSAVTGGTAFGLRRKLKK